MIKIKPKLFSTFFTLIIIAGTVFAVLFTEKNKSQAKANSLGDYYSEIYSNWETYKNDYSKQVEELKRQNALEMEKIKANYFALLEQQPSIIQEHTKTVEQTTNVPQNSTTIGASSNNQTTAKKTISVQRPKSKPTTGAS